MGLWKALFLGAQKVRFVVILTLSECALLFKAWANAGAHRDEKGKKVRFPMSACCCRHDPDRVSEAEWP